MKKVKMRGFGVHLFIGVRRKAGSVTGITKWHGACMMLAVLDQSAASKRMVRLSLG